MTPDQTPSSFDHCAAALRLDAHRKGAPPKTSVRLFLGSDCDIGLAEGHPEQRVGMVPDHLEWLAETLGGLGVTLELTVHQDAGEGSGIPDQAFRQIGAQIVSRSEIAALRGPFDVVHALKEPSKYEADIPGPFSRIGALHTGDFHIDGGLTRLLEKRNVAIFDGSYVGDAKSFRVPIRARMSTFAGEIAADWVSDYLARQDRNPAGATVAVVGGGRVGSAAARRVVSQGVAQVLLFESGSDPERFASVIADHADQPRISVRPMLGCDDPHLLDALSACDGVVFGVARPKQRAPKVVTAPALRQSLPGRGACVVDVSIDERGAIAEETITAQDWPSERIIPHLKQVLLPHEYLAVTNMPRAHPGPASRAHSEVIVPYVAALLWLTAREDGVLNGVRSLFGLRPEGGTSVGPFDGSPDRVLTALYQDLASGLAIAPIDGVLRIADSVPDDDAAAMATHLRNRKIPHAR